MMTNLFSIFDTNTNSIFELNWMSSILIMILNPINYWNFISKLNFIYNKIYLILYMEFKNILKNKFNFLNFIYFISIFLFILMNNIMGLFPYIFTNSSHMIFSISISTPIWISLMLFGWINNLNFMFSHMIPEGTPYILMPFMVLIESISNIIRPMTLTIRLTANMIAGHLLLTLLSQSALNPPYLLISLMIIIIQMILLILEFSVSIIQSYVFTILSTLYTKETN